jgi:hypothetical protein
MEHPLYSSHLALCNFFLFDSIKEPLKETVSSDDEELSVPICAIMTTIPANLLLSGFSQWVKGFRDCINANDDDIE